MTACDILIVGGGAAGIAAAKTAARSTADVWLVDAGSALGGVLRQCLHKGFANGLDGPAYVESLLADFPEHVRFLPRTTVLAVDAQRRAQLAGPAVGRKTLRFDQLILATGCYEIPAGALSIAGTRPHGVYTAGQMQEMMNVHGVVPPVPVVILGSGDLGLIMAQHLADAGLAVTLVEQRTQCGGLARNHGCLAQPAVQLRLGTTITDILGAPALEGVRLSDGTQLPCRTLLIACGLRPERSLVANLGAPDWLHICGNANKVHAMVEAVVQEGIEAGARAVQQWRGEE